MIGSKPYAEFKYREVKGSRMAYIDEGKGDAIVFQHGQPVSSYLWRNVMPHLEGMGRLIACDLIGMGGSDKLDPSLGPERYRLATHRNYLFDLWDQLNLGNRVVLVLDDWGAVLGFDWARQNSQRVQGIVHMEAIAAPLFWSDIPQYGHPLFKTLRSPEGERMVLQENIFIEKILPQAVIRQLTNEELNHYRSPFRNSGEDRRPMLSWPRSLPIDGEPAETAEVVSRNCSWLAQSDVPKLFINGEPGTLARGRLREIIRRWPNQTEVTVKGRKLLEEDSPDEMAAAMADFITRVRGPGKL
ncbi:MAG TPA: haloalkane dehalogenase [Verrucomicrobiae bacterium]|nr:haloalkane dehalogenase [Verrucomicrobiae bacterium]